MFFSSDTSVTENITHFPLGEICGSLTRFIAIKSANVIGRFAPDPGAPFKAALSPWVGYAPLCPVASTPAQINPHTNPTSANIRVIFIAPV